MLWDAVFIVRKDWVSSNAASDLPVFVTPHSLVSPFEQSFTVSAAAVTVVTRTSVIALLKMGNFNRIQKYTTL